VAERVVSLRSASRAQSTGGKKQIPHPARKARGFGMTFFLREWRASLTDLKIGHYSAGVSLRSVARAQLTGGKKQIPHPAGKARGFGMTFFLRKWRASLTDRKIGHYSAVGFVEVGVESAVDRRKKADPSPRWKTAGIRDDTLLARMAGQLDRSPAGPISSLTGLKNGHYSSVASAV
jgi:hypothetical protein